MALVHQVEQPAGRGDDHVDAATQRADLRVLTDAAEDDRVLDVEVLAVGGEPVSDLRGELAGRAQDQRAGAVRRGLGAGEPLQNRQGERGGLAGAGLRGSKEVATFECGRESPWPGWGWR
jgi:hypothetical protein